MDQPTIELLSKDVRNVLEKIVKKCGTENFTIDIATGSIKGDNFLGIISIVTVRSNNNDKVYNFIVKSAPRTGFSRSHMPVTRLYQRETYIYETVVPEFQKFQLTKGILNPFNSFARYYTSLIDENNEAIIMENMKELGFQLLDRRLPYDYNHALLAIKEYGKLHAFSFAFRDQKPDLFKKLVGNLEHISLINEGNEAVYEEYLRSHGQRALETLDPVRDKIAYEKFEHFLSSKMLIKIQTDVKSEAFGKHGVIIHGDCWANNILYKYEDREQPSQPTKLCILDWQIAEIGSPAFDISYLIFVNTDKKLRDEHYDTLIREYYNSFSTFLIELGSDPEQLFPFEVLKEHLKRFSIFGLSLATSAVNMLTREVEDIPDINELDLDKVGELFLDEYGTVDKYNVRMRDIILDFVKLGYL